MGNRLDETHGTSVRDPLRSVWGQGHCTQLSPLLLRRAQPGPPGTRQVLPSTWDSVYPMLKPLRLLNHHTRHSPTCLPSHSRPITTCDQTGILAQPVHRTSRPDREAACPGVGGSLAKQRPLNVFAADPDPDALCLRGIALQGTLLGEEEGVGRADAALQS